MSLFKRKTPPPITPKQNFGGVLIAPPPAYGPFDNRTRLARYITKTYLLSADSSLRFPLEIFK